MSAEDGHVERKGNAHFHITGETCWGGLLRRLPDHCQGFYRALTAEGSFWPCFNKSNAAWISSSMWMLCHVVKTILQDVLRIGKYKTAWWHSEKQS